MQRQSEHKMTAIFIAQREAKLPEPRRLAPNRKTLEFPGLSAPKNRT